MQDGCQWFVSCESCGWPDCMLEGKPAAYDSVKAKSARGELAKGLGQAEASLFFGATAKSISEWSGLAPGRRREVIEARRAGLHECECAEKFGIAARTVRRWCQGEDIPRLSGNSIRKRQRCQ